MELNDLEVSDLLDVLRVAVNDLQEEAFHTDNREYRANLRARRERLQRVLQRLDQQVQAERSEAWV